MPSDRDRDRFRVACRSGRVAKPRISHHPHGNTPPRRALCNWPLISSWLAGSSCSSDYFLPRPCPYSGWRSCTHFTTRLFSRTDAILAHLAVQAAYATGDPGPPTYAAYGYAGDPGYASDASDASGSSDLSMASMQNHIPPPHPQPEPHADSTDPGAGSGSDGLGGSPQSPTPPAEWMHIPLIPLLDACPLVHPDVAPILPAAVTEAPTGAISASALARHNTRHGCSLCRCHQVRLRRRCLQLQLRSLLSILRLIQQQ